ncbi:MAG TPA: acyl-CoA dehydrogenase C-terminal domain-containing protein [Pseudomonadales bacterium]
MPISLKDLRFVVHDVLDYAGHYARLGPRGDGGGEAERPDRAFIDAVLDEAARFAENELEPLNAVGDVTGCRWQDGEVTTPPGFKEAYGKFTAGGWSSLIGDPEYGGQGLPDSMSLMVEDIIACANPAWAMYPALSRGVITVLTAHGSEQHKRAFLPKLLSGEWTGTMCLTEPHAGSDVGLVRTRAEPRGDGTYAITGTKIFISSGEHDLVDNIIHLVLARLPDAPAGTSGISLFVVPKVNLDGTRNGVTCGGIEEKMGIHGNATCVLNFDGATGYLMGEANRGMRYMFTMMNGARLVVGLQGVCGAHAASLRALEYAQERLQMRALTGPAAPDKPADPIIVHGDVRRMLLTQRAIAEGGRMLVYYAGQLADRARRGAEDERERSQQMLDFLTPIVKGSLTELGFESVNLALQIFGGHGYIRETGIEQYVRDARISMVYEGTTGIQALDLLGRKTLQTQGKGLTIFIGEMNALAERLRGPLPELARAIDETAKEWGDLTMALGARALQDVNEVGCNAVDYLLYSGYCVLAYCWGRMAETASRLQDELAREGAPASAFLGGKRAVADFYFARLLPRRHAHRLAIEAGARTVQQPDQSLITEL